MTPIVWDGKPHKSPCRACGASDWYEMRSVCEGDVIYDQCSACPTPVAGISGIPDVYLARSGERFKNLCDKSGTPIEIRSKRHKQEVMASLGVREAGETINGARFGSKSWVEGTRPHRKAQFDKDRPMIRKLQAQYLANSRRKKVQ